MNRRSLLFSLLGIPLVPLIASRRAWAGMDLAAVSGDCTAIVAYRGHCRIPLIDHELSPEAAARAFAEIAAYRPTPDFSGTNYIPCSSFALFHGDDAVVPKVRS